MNPRHRDRAVYVRVVSGEFERDMQVIDSRSGKKVRLGNAQKLFGQERTTLDNAYPGDILALVGNYDFLIGDTLSLDKNILFEELPRFQPECFAYIVNLDTSNIKRYRAGVEQLLKEGVAQSYDVHNAAQRIPLLGAVGPLQFEVFKARLENEYNVTCRLDTCSWSCVRWIRRDEESLSLNETAAPELVLPSGCNLARDQDGYWVVLLPADYLVDILVSRNEDWVFDKLPVVR